MVKTQLILGLPREIVFGVITDNYLYLQSVFTHVTSIRRRWKKEFNSHRIGLGHQHGRRFIVLGHQYGRRDVMWKHSIECFHSRGQQLCKFIGTKESVCIRKEFISHRTGLGHQHGRRFIVLGHQYDRRNVIWKHSIALTKCKKECDIAYYKLFWYKVFVH